MKQSKPHIKELGCYKQVADVIGEVNAQRELWKVVHCEGSIQDDWTDWGKELEYCFDWCSSPQGYDFWDNIDDGINPYEQ